MLASIVAGTCYSLFLSRGSWGIRHNQFCGISCLMLLTCLWLAFMISSLKEIDELRLHARKLNTVRFRGFKACMGLGVKVSNTSLTPRTLGNLLNTPC